MFMPEYGLVPIFYFLGKNELFKTANALQAAFVVGSNAFQYKMYMDTLAKDAEDGVSEKVRGYVQTICGIPVQRLRIPCWAFELISQMPNYVHVSQTAVITAASWKAWNSELKLEYLRRWEVVPLIGHYIGVLGVPGQLTCLLIWSCIAHGFAAFFAKDLGSQADAANLLFLGKVFWSNNPIDMSVLRMAMSVLVKAPKIWVKTSLVALTYDALEAEGALVQGVLAIILAWYATAPLLKALAIVLIQAPWMFKVGASCPIVLLLILALHFVGIFVCPQSHDLAVTRLGCTPTAGSNSTMIDIGIV